MTRGAVLWGVKVIADTGGEAREQDLEAALKEADFRAVDGEMWQ